MDFIIIIQARLSSSRLPNKVLMEIKGTPLLQFLVERLNTVFDKSKLLVATSTRIEDDKIESFCNELNIQCYRGSLNDVSRRFLEAANLKQAKAFARINGDSPLIDPYIVKKALDIYTNGSYDLVTNAFPRTYPAGQSAEVINSRTFSKVYKFMSTEEHFEHVTSYFYENPSKYNIKNFTNIKNLSDHRLVVDTENDFIKITKIIKSMNMSHINYGYKELVKMND
tara:strand:- start:170 stop:844 length:675 start_codon:yes stop_codon:yes gene_type:complete